MNGLRSLWKQVEFDLKDWERLLGEVQEHRLWETIPPTNPYGDIDALLKAEIGLDLKSALDAAVARTKATARRSTPLAKHGGARNGKQGYNGKLAGNSNQYLTARIARDRPDILERMKHGQFRSVRAAAIEAGIIKPKATGPKSARPTLPADPHEAADVIAQRYDKKVIRTLIADLQAVVKGT